MTGPDPDVLALPVPKEELPRGAALYIVASPIGNLADMTLRAISILSRIDRIYCEDTRKTRILLRHYGISTPLKSYRVHQLKRDTEHAILALQEGNRIALLSDAGSPGISDPGSWLVRSVRTRLPELPILALPGPSALAAAISLSGYKSNPTHFFGFLPPKAGKRRRILEGCRGLDGICVFYESVHRIERLLWELRELLAEREVLLFRELTKAFEETLVFAPELSDREWGDKVQGIRKKGEFTIILSPKK